MPVDAVVKAQDQPAPDDGDGGSSTLAVTGRWIVRGIASLIVLASFAVWGYTYYLHLNRPKPPDYLADPTLAPAADEICAATLTTVGEVPGASLASTSKERADQIDASTAAFATMVDELGRFSPADDRDQLIWTGFVGDWQVLIEDRQRFADALETNPEAEFLLTAIAGERLDRRISRVAEANKMYACAAPDDV